MAKFFNKIFQRKALHFEVGNDEDDEFSCEEHSFIFQYLSGKLKKSNVPEVYAGKTGVDLPVLLIDQLKHAVFASSTGPEGGLTQVPPVRKKPATNIATIDDELNLNLDESFDDDFSSNGLGSPNNNYLKNRVSRSSGLVDLVVDPFLTKYNWEATHSRAYGISQSLYECNPFTKVHAGEPIADVFAVCARENNCVMVLGDGVNWGERSRLAARCAVRGATEYLLEHLYSTEKPIRNTLEVFHCLLQAFHTGHQLILQEGGMLTTLCGVVVCPLRGRDDYVACTCNVGDSLAFVYSAKHGVREITLASHDIQQMRDMRDAGGALGPVDGVNPELHNLTCALTVVERDDIVFITSDGVSDNFDPVVGKFCVIKEHLEREKENVQQPQKSKDDLPRQHSAAADIHQRAASSASTPRSPPSARRPGNKSYSARQLSSTTEDEESQIDVYLPVVEAHQRHELMLLRMEDLLCNGVTVGDPQTKCAQDLCNNLINFANQLTMAKRRILEDVELYEGKPRRDDQRLRRRMVRARIAEMPGKLDHATVVAYSVGVYQRAVESNERADVPTAAVAVVATLQCRSESAQTSATLAPPSVASLRVAVHSNGSTDGGSSSSSTAPDGSSSAVTVVQAAQVEVQTQSEAAFAAVELCTTEVAFGSNGEAEGVALQSAVAFESAESAIFVSRSSSHSSMVPQSPDDVARFDGSYSPLESPRVEADHPSHLCTDVLLPSTPTAPYPSSDSTPVEERSPPLSAGVERVPFDPKLNDETGVKMIDESSGESLASSLTASMLGVGHDVASGDEIEEEGRPVGEHSPTGRPEVPPLDFGEFLDNAPSSLAATGHDAASSVMSSDLSTIMEVSTTAELASTSFAATEGDSSGSVVLVRGRTQTVDASASVANGRASNGLLPNTTSRSESSGETKFVSCKSSVENGMENQPPFYHADLARRMAASKPVHVEQEAEESCSTRRDDYYGAMFDQLARQLRQGAPLVSQPAYISARTTSDLTVVKPSLLPVTTEGRKPRTPSGQSNAPTEDPSSPTRRKKSKRDQRYTVAVDFEILQKIRTSIRGGRKKRGGAADSGDECTSDVEPATPQKSSPKRVFSFGDGAPTSPTKSLRGSLKNFVTSPPWAKSPTGLTEAAKKPPISPRRTPPVKKATVPVKQVEAPLSRKLTSFVSGKFSFPPRQKSFDLGLLRRAAATPSVATVSPRIAEEAPQRAREVSEPPPRLSDLSSVSPGVCKAPLARGVRARDLLLSSPRAVSTMSLPTREPPPRATAPRHGEGGAGVEKDSRGYPICHSSSDTQVVVRLKAKIESTV